MDLSHSRELAGERRRSVAVLRNLQSGIDMTGWSTKRKQLVEQILFAPTRSRKIPTVLPSALWRDGGMGQLWLYPGFTVREQ
jgi:hypothetical protein